MFYVTSTPTPDTGISTETLEEATEVYETIKAMHVTPSLFILTSTGDTVRAL